jgi:hypothetical protein
VMTRALRFPALYLFFFSHASKSASILLCAP